MMLIGYLQAAMRRARYEILEDGDFYGEIPGFQGVFASADNLEDCRQQLEEVLEDWLVLGLRMGHSLPVVDNISLTAELVPA